VAGSVLGHAHWFFGNLYEGLVLAPGWASVAGGPLEVAGGVLAEGSPVRYYIPITPLTVLVTAAAALAGWRARSPAGRMLLAGLTLTVAGAAVTGYMVGQINLDLFFDAATAPDRREALADRWVLWNYVRLATVGGALACLAAAWHRCVAERAAASGVPAPPAG
jgi:hypothetical protein